MSILFDGDTDKHYCSLAHLPALHLAPLSGRTAIQQVQPGHPQDWNL